jgi:hypothetical protein
MFGYINTRAHARPDWVTADEVGAFCAYLASQEASMVSGGVIQVGNRPALSQERKLPVFRSGTGKREGGWGA